MLTRGARWGVPLFCVLLGVAHLMVFWISDNPVAGIGPFAIMVTYGALLFFGGRSDGLRVLRDQPPDQRYAPLHIRAMAFAGLVTTCSSTRYRRAGRITSTGLSGRWRRSRTSGLCCYWDDVPSFQLPVGLQGRFDRPITGLTRKRTAEDSTTRQTGFWLALQKGSGSRGAGSQKFMKLLLDVAFTTQTIIQYLHVLPQITPATKGLYVRNLVATP